MNIAILFSGRIFGYEKTIESYKEHIYKENTHIFIAHNAYNPEDLSIFNSSKNIHVTSELYVMPESPPIRYSNPGTDPNGYYLSSMWYNRNLAYKMMKEFSLKNNIKFDIVISARLDALIKSPLITPVEENTIYIPNNEDHGGLNDQFAYGTMDIMEVYCNLYNNVKTVTPGPETLLKDYIKTTGINIKRIDLVYQLLGDRHLYNNERTHDNRERIKYLESKGMHR